MAQSRRRHGQGRGAEGQQFCSSAGVFGKDCQETGMGVGRLLA